jgi:hypothetical protein
MRVSSDVILTLFFAICLVVSANIFVRYMTGKCNLRRLNLIVHQSIGHFVTCLLSLKENILAQYYFLNQWTDFRVTWYECYATGALTTPHFKCPIISNKTVIGARRCDVGSGIY